MTIENCADSIAASISSDIRKVQEGKHIYVSVPVDAITYSQSSFGLAFQEFLTSAMASRLPGVVDVHFRSPADKSAKAGSSSLSRSELTIEESSAGIVLVSTYLAGEEEVVITTRAIDAALKEVIASTHAVLSRSGEVDALFGRSQGIPMYEK
jgi:hypothetical protein